MSHEDNKTGLCVDVREDTPTIIECEGRIIKLFKTRIPCGNMRLRIVADRDIKITGPHRVKKSHRLDTDKSEEKE